jgi:hypothetical protein
LDGEKEEVVAVLWVVSALKGVPERDGEPATKRWWCSGLQRERRKRGGRRGRRREEGEEG